MKIGSELSEGNRDFNDLQGWETEHRHNCVTEVLLPWGYRALSSQLSAQSIVASGILPSKLTVTLSERRGVKRSESTNWFIMILVDDKQVEALEARRAAEEQLNVRGFDNKPQGYFFLNHIDNWMISKNHHQLMHLCNLRRVFKQGHRPSWEPQIMSLLRAYIVLWGKPWSLIHLSSSLFSFVPHLHWEKQRRLVKISSLNLRMAMWTPMLPWLKTPIPKCYQVRRGTAE